MKLLFIDHECHKKTRSAEFFLEVVRRAFEIAEHYYSRYYKTGAEKAMTDCDGAIIWEFSVSRRRFYFPGKVNVFVPMYDNEWASFWQWKRIAWSGMGVISFCDKVSAHARKCGVRNILDVRFFPDPVSLPQEKGDPKRVFLWERGGIEREVAEQLFPEAAGYTFVVKRGDEFIDKLTYLGRVAQCGIVVAPRRKEGIGMSFLEAMAMGKCVAAYDDATMNEYIEDGENGILFSDSGLRPVSEEVVAHVRDNVSRSAHALRGRWLDGAAEINDFLRGQKPCRPSLLNRLKIALAYPLFLVEGALRRLAANGSVARE